MLILAGVSLNAIIGDNGIITNAQNATIKSSIAALEEVLQEKYVEIEGSRLSASENSLMSSLEKVHDIYHEWFYSHGTYNYVVYEYSYVNEEGEDKTDYLTIYLINKNGLRADEPELANTLRGGDANGNDTNAYLNFQDVYGVTSDLKVFYCSDGLDSAIGASYRNSGKFDSEKTIYSKSSGIAKAIANTKGKEAEDLSLSSLYSVQNLTISGSDGVTDLSSLYELTSLKKLTLINYTGSLRGIEYANRLTYLYIDNSGGTTSINYNGLRGTTNLTELYFYMPTDTEVNHLMVEMGNADYPYLETLGLYGFLGYNESPTSTSEWSDSTHSLLTTVADLDKLSDLTKSKIKVLYIENNSLTDLDGVEDFLSIEVICAQWNYINDISAVSGLTTLSTLKLYRNGSGLTSLSAIDGLTALKRLLITYDSGITSLRETITNGKTLVALLANGIEGLDFETNTTFWTMENKEELGKIEVLNLSPKYDLLFSNKATITLSAEVTNAQFLGLTNNTYIKELYLNGNKNVTDDSLQTVLPTLTSMYRLDANKSNLASLDWCNDVEDKKVLSRMDLSGTAVTKITQLKDFPSLYRLKVDGTVLKIYDELDEELTEDSTEVLNNIGTVNPSSAGGFIPNSASIQRQIEKLSNLQYFGFYDGGVYLSKDIDLTDTSLIAINHRVYYGGSGKIICPSSTQKIAIHSGAHVELESNKNLDSIYIDWSGCLVDVDEHEADDGQIEFEFNGQVFDNISIWSDLLTSEINKLILTASVSSYKLGETCLVSSSLLSNLTSCLEMRFSYINFTKLDGTDFPTTVQKITINDCAIEGFQNIENITSLSYLDLRYNSISTLPDFYKLKTDCLLETIDLRNNTLQNLTTVGTGESTSSPSTCSVLARLTNLKNAYFAGNNDLTNFDAMISAGFNADGKNYSRK